MLVLLMQVLYLCCSSLFLCPVGVLLYKCSIFFLVVSFRLSLSSVIVVVSVAIFIY